MGVATKFGEKIVIQNVADDLRAEDIVRAIAVVSDNLVGVADHANVGKVIKNSLIPGAITYAQEIGRVLEKQRKLAEMLLLLSVMIKKVKYYSEDTFQITLVKQEMASTLVKFI